MSAVDIGGHTWQLSRVSDYDAFEVECIAAQLYGPALGVVIGELAEGFAAQIVEFTGTVLSPAKIPEGEHAWDLRRILELGKLNSYDKRVQALWESMGKQLPVRVGNAIAAAGPELFDRADHVKTRRLFELLVLERAFVLVDGKPRAIGTWDALAEFTDLNWRIKRELLLAALLDHFGVFDVLAEAEKDGAS